jgi:ubiquinone/menaquinone biosynthesis C-methylase UbiE
MPASTHPPGGAGALGCQSAQRAASTGLPLTDATWLDIHLEAYRPEYEAMLASAGLQPGWRVLDAGCGSGSFLALMAGHVGQTGSIAALDVAPDSIAAVEQRLAAAPLACPVETRVGSVTALPYPDGHFDAVWIGNVLMYFDDAALADVLTECKRVIRPGGLLAVKEPDPALQRFFPADPMVSLHFFDAWRRQFGYERMIFSGWFRTRELRRWLERAGFVDVRQRTFPIERWAPLTATERQYFADTIAYLASLADELDLPDDEHAFWRIQRDPTSPDHLLNQPDFYSGAGQVVVIGHVLGGTEAK